MDAFDADVLIYAAVRDHPLGQRVKVLLDDDALKIGSVLLIPELLSKPMREGAGGEVRALSLILAGLHLASVDRTTAKLATALAGKYRLRALDATHLATAIERGADRFITNNSKDFSERITEIDVVHPVALPEP